MRTMQPPRWFGRRILVVGCVASVLGACTVTSPAPAESPTPAPAIVSATAAPPTPGPTLPTATPREEPPAVASDPVAIAAQVAVAERAVRDLRLTGATLAWMGHLQQRAYRAVAARPEWHDAFLAAVPADLRAVVTAYAEVMRAEPNAYRGYYNWQVYYLTTKGDILLPVGYGS